MFSDKHIISLRFAVVALLAMVMMSGSRPSIAAPQQAFLKVNQYYVLFTNPIVPFINRHGDFIVGLQGFSELIGAHVTSAKGSETVSFRNKSVKFVYNSRTIYIDGKADHIADPPQKRAALQSTDSLRSRADTMSPPQMLVSVNVLAHLFDLPISWEPRSRILLIQDKSLEFPEIECTLWAEDIRRFEWPELSPDPLKLVEVTLRPGSLPVYDTMPSMTAQFKKMKILKFTAQNSSDQDFAEGQAYMNFFSEGCCYHGAEPGSPDIPDPAPLAWRRGALRSVVTEVNEPNSLNVRYAVAWLVVKKMNSQASLW